MKTIHILGIIGALAAVGVLVGFNYFFTNSVPHASAAVYQPTTNIKSWIINSTFGLSNPIFTTSETSGLVSGYVQMSANVTNYGSNTIQVRVPFVINGIQVDYADNARVFTINPGSTISVYSRQTTMSMGMMDAVVSVSSADGTKLYAQKSVLVNANNWWQLASVAPQSWYDVAPDKVAFSMGNYNGTTNQQSGLVNMYTEFFNCANSTAYEHEVNYIDVPLSKVGNPTGPIYVGIARTNSTAGDPVISKLFSKIDASSLTTTPTYYRFYSPDPYPIKICSDHVGIKYVHVNPTGSYVQVYGSNSDVFGGTADHTRYSKDLTIMYDSATDAAMRLGVEAYQILSCNDPNNNLQFYFCQNGGQVTTTAPVGGQPV